MGERFQCVPLRSLVPGRNRDGLLGLGHGCVFAMTGGGKTEFLRWLSKGSGRVVLVYEPEGEPFPGVTVRSPAELRRGIAEGRRKFHVVGDDMGHFDRYMRVLMSLGDEARKKTAKRQVGHWCTVIVDEVHLLDKKGSKEGPLFNAYTRARKRGIHIWSASQDPAQMPHYTITQSRVRVSLAVDAERVDYLRNYFPMDEVWEHINQPYHWAVRVGNQYALCRPVRV